MAVVIGPVFWGLSYRLNHMAKCFHQHTQESMFSHTENSYSRRASFWKVSQNSASDHNRYAILWLGTLIPKAHKGLDWLTSCLAIELRRLSTSRTHICRKEIQRVGGGQRMESDRREERQLTRKYINHLRFQRCRAERPHAHVFPSNLVLQLWHFSH